MFDNELTILTAEHVFYITGLQEVTKTARLSPNKHLF